MKIGFWWVVYGSNIELICLNYCSENKNREVLSPCELLSFISVLCNLTSFLSYWIVIFSLLCNCITLRGPLILFFIFIFIVGFLPMLNHQFLYLFVILPDHSFLSFFFVIYYIIFSCFICFLKFSL